MAQSIPPVPSGTPPLYPDSPLHGTSPASTAVSGKSNFGAGVSGESVGQPGVEGSQPPSDGVFGQGRNGVHGLSSSHGDSGVWGENRGGGYGVSGVTNSTFQPGPNVVAAVWGMNNGSGAGVKGISAGGDGVVGFSRAKDHAGVSAVGDGVGLWAGGTPAGHFEGDVEVTGDIRLSNQDCAEDFDISGVEAPEPGTVMVIEKDGTLQTSQAAYDRRVAGVVSGAGDLRPAIILGRQKSSKKRRPIALLGKVMCKVDAQYATIDVGDLLTSSGTPGHAMKALDPQKAFGAIIGKALRPLKDGQGLIPILIALQ